MDVKDAQFLKKLLAMFKVEAREHLAVISAQLARTAGSDATHQVEGVEVMYREAHSLKGAARSVNLAEIVGLCQALENVFALVQKGKMTLAAESRELLQQTVDFCYGLVDEETPSAAQRAAGKKLINRLDGLVAGQATLAPGEDRLFPGEVPLQYLDAKDPFFPDHPSVGDLSAPSIPPPGTRAIPGGVETVRVATARLDALLLQAEEMIGVKMAIGQGLAELKEVQKSFELWRKDRQKHAFLSSSRRNGGSEAAPAEPFLGEHAARLATLVKAAENDHRLSGALIDTLLADMKKTLMLPISSLFEVFPRLVRDLAREGGKKVELLVEGGAIEIDRRVLEEMKDPIIHLVRNCLDHGIELPREREAKGKPAGGTVRISATSRDDKIEIIVADDGRGIDMAQIKAAAVQQDLVTAEIATGLGEQESLALLFCSGITTSPIITDLSGRGLGLPIVREKVEKLSGTVTVETVVGVGTTIRMDLPLTLATFRGTLVRVDDRIFVLPSSRVDRVARVNRATIRTIENRETLVIDGQPLSLVRLGDVLGLPRVGGRRQGGDTHVQVVVLDIAGNRLAFMVDEILCEQEVLVKPLGRQLARVRNIMGATVLGDGKVALVINGADLLQSALKAAPAGTDERPEQPEKAGSVLVVEDSITARSLLKGILAAAGYEVQAVGDGEDAVTALKKGHFDIVVSDVEMPRMNGFDLTARIRADKKMAELPVVLVTALESRADRARGIEVGANAYIVKSSFDQSNLLEVVGRLL